MRHCRRHASCGGEPPYLQPLGFVASGLRTVTTKVKYERPAQPSVGWSSRSWRSGGARRARRFCRGRSCAATYRGSRSGNRLHGTKGFDLLAEALLFAFASLSDLFSSGSHVSLLVKLRWGTVSRTQERQSSGTMVLSLFPLYHETGNLSRISNPCRVPSAPMLSEDQTFWRPISRRRRPISITEKGTPVRDLIA